MADVAMPRLSDSMEEGTIVRWLKSDGDQVSKGDEIVEIETDKATMTYEADEDGVLETVASEGDTLPVGDTIARIGEGGGSGSEGDGGAGTDEDEPEAEPAGDGDGGDEAAEDQDEPEAEPAPDDGGDDDDEAQEGDAAAAPKASGDGDGDGDGRIKASPVARRLAEEQGVDLESIEGTGPGGRIVKADVEAAAQGGDGAEEAPADGGDGAPAPQGAPAPAKGEGGARGQAETHELTRLQQLVARRMAESKATAPDFSITVEVDMEAAVQLRRELSAASPEEVTPSFNDFVIKAAALALRDFPRANGAYRDAKFELYGRVNVGMAVAGQDALVVPTIFDADKKSLGEIARDAKGLARKVRDGKITPPELSGGTFTVSNLGMYGIRRFNAVLNPPQAGILAVGALEPRAVVRDGQVQARNTMELTLTCDHRILYGAEAAEFLARIRERLEQPLMLAL